MFTKEKTNCCKGVAVLFLIFHHLFRTSEIIDARGMHFYVLPQAAVPGIATSLRVCVWMFVFLSAYGLNYKYSHMLVTKRASFVPRQWFSLMKPFWVIYLLSLVVFAIIGRSLVDLYQGSVLNGALDMLAWADFFHTPLLCGVYWYMCLAQLLVLLTPFFSVAA